LNPTAFRVTMVAMDEPGDAEVVEEVVDAIPVENAGLPVVAEVYAVESMSRPAAGRGAVQAAAAAATGFVAGAATLALARRYGARKVVHVLGRPSE
jgi:hypothetical protein